MAEPPLLDHVGWRLWEASRRWQARFERGMADAGHGWLAEARGALVPHIDRAGTRQSVLADRLKLTKQAVQQLVDALVADGIVERRADPDDARARLVCFTRKGLQVLADANAVKQRIERDYERSLGKAELARLNTLLDRLTSIDDVA